MSDGTHLKIVALLWAVIACVAASSEPSWAHLIFGLAGLAYIASFFARGQVQS